MNILESLPQNPIGADALVESIQATDSFDEKVEILSKFIRTNVTFCCNADTNELMMYTGTCYKALTPKDFGKIYRYLTSRAEIAWNAKAETSVLGLVERDTVKKVTFNTQNALNLKNGVFDFDSGKVIPHSPETAYFTYTLDYAENRFQKITNFQAFLKRTFDSDDEKIKLCQEVFGYYLSAKTVSETAWIFYGPGGSGKSTAANILEHLVGHEQVAAVSTDSMSGTFSLSPLIGKRINIAAENGYISSPEKLKSLISCDVMNVPIKYGSDWIGRLSAKHLFIVNCLPESSDTSNGLMRKLCILNFDNALKPEDIDKDLLGKILEELPGIIWWAYRGYKRLKDNDFRFSECQASLDAHEEYQSYINPTWDFFKTTFEKAENEKILRSKIYEKYIAWTNDSDSPVLNKKRFWDGLKSAAAQNNEKLEYVKINGLFYLKNYKPIESEKAFEEQISFFH